jgi:hypothetical protein
MRFSGVRVYVLSNKPINLIEFRSVGNRSPVGCYSRHTAHPALPLKGGRNLLLDVDGQGRCILFSALKECNNQNATSDFVRLVFSLSPGRRGQG